MIHHQLPCVAARERLSARLDGEADDEPGLEAHLALCDDCRVHERALADLEHAFAQLRRAPVPLEDLWPSIERRVRRRARTPLVARAAAALVGFLGVAGAVRMLEAWKPSPTSSPHLIERLLAASSDVDPFPSLPEVRLLRAFPSASDEVAR